MLDHPLDHATACARFRWNIPTYYNIGTDVCDRLADRVPERLALIDVDEDGGVPSAFSEATSGAIDLPAACAQQSDRFEAVATRAEDPALLIYTSGTTGHRRAKA